MFPRNGGQPAAFRYFNLLAPVLGDDLMFTDADSSAADATLEHILDADPALCRFKSVYIHVCRTQRSRSSINQALVS